MDRWQCCKVKDIADVTVGLVIKPTRFYTDDANNGIKAFRSLNVREMRVNDSDWVYFSKEGNEQNKKSQLQKGDVLIVRSGYPGTSCVVTDEYVGCNAIDIIIARPNQEKVNPYYLCAFNNFPHGMNQIQHGTGGAAQKHFNVGAYNDMVIAVPPMKLQNDFVEFMGQTDKSKYEIVWSNVMLNKFQKILYNSCALSILLVEFSIISFYQDENCYFIIPIMIISVLMIIYQWFLIRKSKTVLSPIVVNIDTISVKDKISLLPCLSYVIMATKIMWSEINIWMLLIVSVVVVLGSLRMNENAVNPILAFMGYKIYTVKLKTGVADYTLLSKKNLRNTKQIKRVYRMFEYLLLEE